jgi:two-component system, NarL family, sensor histidine kinase DevS
MQTAQKSNLYATPAARLTALSLLGLGLAASMLFWMLQPSTGMTFSPQNWRSPFQLPAGFWVGWTVGLGAWLISAWVFSLKPREPAVILFALSGLLTLTFTFAATPSLVAMPISPLIGTLGAKLNMFGATGFGITMICLFAIYPRHLPNAMWICGAMVTIFGIWSAAFLLNPNASSDEGQLITLVEMLAIVALALWQAVRPHPDPAARAIAIWLGVSVLFGAGPFIGLVALPLSFGFQNLIDENLAFASFLLIYIGLAAGLVRYRLFDLGTWAYGLLFDAGAACVILLLDVALVGIMTMTPNAAFATTLLIVALAWLPARDLIWNHMTRRSKRDDAGVFQSMVQTVLQPLPASRASGWQAVLQDVFQPLEISETQHMLNAPELNGDGSSMIIPAVLGGPALKLTYAKSGEALFSRKDSELARQLVLLANHIDESRSAYDQGVAQERTRIARDIHDNIGAHLMRALHSEQGTRKDAMIRETLSDLRDIINNASDPGLILDTIASDLRAETADRLDPHNIALIWQFDVDDTVQPSQGQLQTIRAVIREATSNAIKHAKPSQFSIALIGRDHILRMVIRDDGQGMDPNIKSRGHGLENMRGRFASLGGKLEFVSDTSGTSLIAVLPIGALETPVNMAQSENSLVLS